MIIKEKDSVYEKHKLLLRFIWEGSWGLSHINWCLSFYNKKHYLQVENIQNTHQSSNERMHQNIPKSDSAVIREIAKNQRAASQAVQVSVNLLNVTMFGENHTQHTDTNTSYQPWSTVVERGWFGLILQSQYLDTLQSLRHELLCIPNYCRANVRSSVWKLVM